MPWWNLSEGFQLKNNQTLSQHNIPCRELNQKHRIDISFAMVLCNFKQFSLKWCTTMSWVEPYRRAPWIPGNSGCFGKWFKIKLSESYPSYPSTSHLPWSPQYCSTWWCSSSARDEKSQLANESILAFHSDATWNVFVCKWHVYWPSWSAKFSNAQPRLPKGGGPALLNLKFCGWKIWPRSSGKTQMSQLAQESRIIMLSRS